MEGSPDSTDRYRGARRVAAKAVAETKVRKWEEF